MTSSPIGGDWAITPDQEFQDKLAQRYAYHAAIARLQEQGFALAADEVQENGQVHLTLRRMA